MAPPPPTCALARWESASAMESRTPWLMVDIELCSSRILGTMLFDERGGGREMSDGGEMDDGGVLMWCGR